MIPERQMSEIAAREAQREAFGKQVFDNVIARLHERIHAYNKPGWIHGGPEWDHGRFYPERYDPARPRMPKGELYITEKNPELLLENPFDLDNLRIIDKERVQRFLHNLEELVADPESEGKEIVGMINSGGTVMMKPDEGGVLRPGISGNELLGRLGGQVADQFAVETMDLPTPIDSSQMEVDYGADLVISMAYIWDNASEALKKRLNGIAIAHGTDTMAGTSSNVAMMLGPDLPFPVGFFGAQKTLGNVPTDVQANTVTALQSIKHLKRDNINTVFVAMGGTSGGAYLAVGVDKVNDDRMVGFSSPAHPKILDSDNFFAYGSRFDFKDRYIGLQPGRQTSTLRSTEKKWFPVISRGYSPVLSITPKMGHDPDVIRRIVEVTPELKYVSLTTFGSFTTNSKIQDAILTIKDVQEGKRMVIAANPFPEGSTDHKYETTRRMKESGLIVPTAVLPIALEAKLMVADRVIGSDRSDVVDFLNSTNYVGEQPLGHWNSLASEGDVQFGLPNGFPRILHRGKIPEDSRLD